MIFTKVFRHYSEVAFLRKSIVVLLELYSVRKDQKQII